jgi:hypothetical protein
MSHATRDPLDEIPVNPLSIEEIYFISRATIHIQAEKNDILLADLLLKKAIAEGEEGKPQFLLEDRKMFDDAMSRIAANRLMDVIDPQVEIPVAEG